MTRNKDGSGERIVVDRRVGATVAGYISTAILYTSCMVFFLSRNDTGRQLVPFVTDGYRSMFASPEFLHCTLIRYGVCPYEYILETVLAPKFHTYTTNNGNPSSPELNRSAR